MDTLIFMNRAINKIGSIPYNTEFNLKDLFDGVEWAALAKGDRLGFGKLFKHEVLANHIPNVIFIGKSDNNSALYRKEK